MGKQNKILNYVKFRYNEMKAINPQINILACLQQAIIEWNQMNQSQEISFS